jgi:hypothetical protein
MPQRQQVYSELQQFDDLPSDAIPLVTAALIARASKKTVKNWVDRGLIRAWKRGIDGRLLFSRSEIVSKCCYHQVGTLKGY